MKLTESERAEKVREMNDEVSALEARLVVLRSRVAEAEEAYEMATIARATRQDDLEEAEDAMDQLALILEGLEMRLRELEREYDNLLAEVSALSGLTYDGESLMPDAYEGDAD
jgi:predicted  nucleic acid-binding Zn-ribbon protein